MGESLVVTSSCLLVLEPVSGAANRPWADEAAYWSGYWLCVQAGSRTLDVACVELAPPTRLDGGGRRKGGLWL